MTASALPANPVAGLRRVVECMGTVFTFDVRTPGISPDAVDAAAAWLHDVDATFSTYRPDSEVSRLGRGELPLADCSPDVQWVLTECARLEDETDGWFSAHPCGRLDPSGLVKGWAIERASDMIAAAGSRAHCVNGGGDVQCVGDASVGRPWRIGVAHPLLAGELAAVVVGTGLAVATSGTAERGAHVIDPHTGEPANALASLTIVGARLGLTDAYATAAFAMGDGGREFVEALPGHEAFAVRLDGSTWRTSGWVAG